MPRILYKVYVKSQEVVYKKSKKDSPVFTIILGIIKVFFYEIGFLISMLFSVCSIVESILYEMKDSSNRFFF